MTTSLNRVRALNPTLYSLLQRRFESVQFSNEGAGVCGQPMPDSIMPGCFRFEVVSWGEYYRIRCPFCKDDRHRLWVNHLYGQPNQKGYPDTWLAVCYNENCTASPGRRDQLYQMIFGFQNVRDRVAPAVIEIGDNSSLPLGMAQPPGEILRLTELSQDHPARTYLIGRRFDPDWLYENFKVGWVFRAFTDVDQRLSIMQGRIYLPVYMNGCLAGWQGRLAYDPPKDGPPKYYTMPSMPKKRILYNFDVAKHWPFVVVVEGVTSVWRIGGPAVAIFGKTLGAGQQMLLQSTWAGKPIVLLLDPDAREDMEGILRELELSGKQPIIPIWLPPGYDPADYETPSVVGMIRSASRAVGIELPAW